MLDPRDILAYWALLPLLRGIDDLKGFYPALDGSLWDSPNFLIDIFSDLSAEGMSPWLGILISISYRFKI